MQLADVEERKLRVFRFFVLKRPDYVGLTYTPYVRRWRTASYCRLREFENRALRMLGPKLVKSRRREKLPVYSEVFVIICSSKVIFFYHDATALVAKAFSLSRFVVTLRHTHTRQDSSGLAISPTQRPLPDKTQLSQERDIDNPGGIRTQNPSKQAAADPRFGPCGHWDRLNKH
jgi:hypothetical protein